MVKKLRSLLGGAGFYVALALCLIAVGIGGYVLLLRPSAELTETETLAPAEAVQVVDAAEPMAEPAVSMPEETVTVVAPVTEPAAELTAEPTPAVSSTEPDLVVSPLRGEVLTAFSVDQLVYNTTLEDWRVHDGVDISAQAGTSVMAACAGTVSTVTQDALMGTTVVLDHGGGYQTTYANLQETPTVTAGDSVSAGQIIGAVGTTAVVEYAQGPHLHFSVTKDGDVVDPEGFLGE